MIERPDLIEDGYWASIAHRVMNWEEWNGIIHAWTTKHTTAEVVALAAELRIPVAPVCDGPAVVELEQAAARGSWTDDPSGRFRVPRRSWRIDGEGSPPPRPAPRLGEHTGAVVPRPPKAPATRDRTLPLHGVKVLDLTAWWAGPSASAMLAALGADVVHVESVTRPDGMRFTSGVSTDRRNWWDYSALFHVSNTNKRDLTLDLARPEGRELALRMVEQCDIVLENYTPRVIEQFDLGWDVVHARNPRAVMVRMPAFGLDGPWRDRPGFAQTMEQVTGLAWLTGHVDDQPRIQRGPCDPNGGMHAVVGGLVALEVRDRTGVGSLVESTMFEAALNISAELIVEWTAYGNPLSREGSRSPVGGAAGHLRDRRAGTLAGALGGDRRAVVGAGRRPRPARLGDRCGPGHARRSPRRARRARRRGSAPGRPRSTSTRRSTCSSGPGSRRHPPTTPAAPPSTRSSSPATTTSSSTTRSSAPTRHPSLPFRYASVDRWMRTPAPMLGQHNHEILTGLGLSDDEIAELEAADLIGTDTPRPVT